MEDLNQEIFNKLRNRCELSIGCSIYNDKYIENVVKQFEKFKTLRPEYLVFCKDPASMVLKLRAITGLKIFVGGIDIEDKLACLAGKMSLILDEQEDLDYPKLRKYLVDIMDRDICYVMKNNKIKIINRLATTYDFKGLGKKTSEDYNTSISRTIFIYDDKQIEDGFKHYDIQEVIDEKETEKQNFKILVDGVELDIPKIQKEADEWNATQKQESEASV